MNEKSAKDNSLVVNDIYFVKEEVTILEDSNENTQTVIFPAIFLGNNLWKPVSFPLEVASDGNFVLDGDKPVPGTSAEDLLNFHGHGDSDVALIRTKIVSFHPFPKIGDFQAIS